MYLAQWPIEGVALNMETGHLTRLTEEHSLSIDQKREINHAVRDLLENFGAPAADELTQADVFLNAIPVILRSDVFDQHNKQVMHQIIRDQIDDIFELRPDKQLFAEMLELMNAEDRNKYIDRIIKDDVLENVGLWGVKPFISSSILRAHAGLNNYINKMIISHDLELSDYDQLLERVDIILNTSRTCFNGVEFDERVKDAAKEKLVTVFSKDNVLDSLSLGFYSCLWMGIHEDSTIADLFWQSIAPHFGQVNQGNRLEALPERRVDLPLCQDQLAALGYNVTLSEDKNNNFICPIGLDAIDPSDAVAIVDNKNKTVHVFNYHNLSQWLHHSDKNPMTNLSVTRDMLMQYEIGAKRDNTNDLPKLVKRASENSLDSMSDDEVDSMDEQSTADGAGVSGNPLLASLSAKWDTNLVNDFSNLLTSHRIDHEVDDLIEFLIETNEQPTGFINTGKKWEIKLATLVQQNIDLADVLKSQGNMIAIGEHAEDGRVLLYDFEEDRVYLMSDLDLDSLRAMGDFNGFLIKNDVNLN